MVRLDLQKQAHVKAIRTLVNAVRLEWEEGGCGKQEE